MPVTQQADGVGRLKLSQENSVNALFSAPASAPVPFALEGDRLSVEVQGSRVHVPLETVFEDLANNVLPENFRLGVEEIPRGHGSLLAAFEALRWALSQMRIVEHVQQQMEYPPSGTAPSPTSKDAP